MEMIFLGTGAGNGVPVFYCGCKVCREAEVTPRCRRTRCAIAVTGEKNILFDAPPEISSQLMRENLSAIDHLFLTHAHHDHTAGLGDLAIYIRFFRGGKLPAVMSNNTLIQLEAQYGQVEDWLDVTAVEPGQNLSLGRLNVTALNVSHSPGTLGYLLDYQGSRTAYIPDTGPLPPETKSLLSGIDRLILDGTFLQENWYPNEHLTIEAAIATALELSVGKLYLTHLSMHYAKPVTCAELEESFRPYGNKVHLAYDGLRLNLIETRNRHCKPVDQLLPRHSEVVPVKKELITPHAQPRYCRAKA
jgi:phosphoribosyl 1,2-cyclic phosphate phosphodiesterase